MVRDQIRVRFAPSPTGYLHVGGLRTALFNYLYAKKTKGKFILRIEDTDKERFVKGSIENLIKTLKTLGLNYDEGPDKEGDFGPYIQSLRTNIYTKYAKELLNSGHAYYCFCSEKRLEKLREEQKRNKLTIQYDGKCRNLSEKIIKDKLKNNIPHVIRLKFPKKGKTTFFDKIRGMGVFDNAEIDDQILIKSDGLPTYHLANVIDDHLMKISHIIRGEEWISSVPKHIYLYKAFGWKLPKFIHLPLLLNPDKSKLSKRQGDVAVRDYLKKGYLPQALINFIALLGWHPADDREIYSLKELENKFSLNRITKSGAVFDINKLKWMNGYYIKKLDFNYIAERTKTYFKKADIDISDKNKYLKVIKNGQKRISTLSEIVNQSKMFYRKLAFTKDEKKLMHENDSQKIYIFWIKELSENKKWSSEEINQLVKKSTIELGIKGKNFYFPLRLALYGNFHGPDIPTIVDILGKKETISRLNDQVIKNKFT